MLIFGFWAWTSPDSFADFTGFETHTHYLHDAGVFQIGIGAALLAIPPPSTGSARSAWLERSRWLSG